jgi:hypothetical protein
MTRNDFFLSNYIYLSIIAKETKNPDRRNIYQDFLWKLTKSGKTFCGSSAFW